MQAVSGPLLAGGGRFYRITRTLERRFMLAAHHVVMLTNVLGACLPAATRSRALSPASHSSRLAAYLRLYRVRCSRRA
jgi:hypothetical protein